MLGWQRGLVQWLVLPERSVTQEGGDDCSTAVVFLALLSLGHRRGKVFEKGSPGCSAWPLETHLADSFSAARRHPQCPHCSQWLPKILGGFLRP